MKILFSIISKILHPILIPSYGALLLAFFDPYISPYLELNFKIFIPSTVLFFTGLIPTSVIFAMMWTGKVSDMDISNGDQRNSPFIITLIGYIACTYLLWYIGMPIYWSSTLLGATICILFVTTINIKWKISAHSAAMGGLVGGIIGIGYTFQINNSLLIATAIILSGLVCASRIFLRVHSLAQIIAGWILGLICVLCTILFIA